MTEQQARVAALIADAWLDKAIAAHLGISHARVRKIVMEIAEAWHLDPARNLRVQIARQYLLMSEQSEQNDTVARGAPPLGI